MSALPRISSALTLRADRDDDRDFEGLADHPVALLQFRIAPDMPDSRWQQRVKSVSDRGPSPKAAVICRFLP